MRIQYSGVLLAMYLAIGVAVTDEEQVKTLLLMLGGVCPLRCGFRGLQKSGRRTRRTRRENQSITVAYKLTYAFSTLDAPKSLNRMQISLSSLLRTE